MAVHGPTLGSRLQVWRDPFRNKRRCKCGGKWPCQRAAEATHAWSADDGRPIPDGAPMDFIQTAYGIYQLTHGERGKNWAAGG